MANNEVVQPVLDQEEDPVVVDPAENENDEQEDQEQEIEQEIEQAENEDVFEDTVKVLPDNKPPIPQPKLTPHWNPLQDLDLQQPTTYNLCPAVYSLQSPTSTLDSNSGHSVLGLYPLGLCKPEGL